MTTVNAKQRRRESVQNNNKYHTRHPFWRRPDSAEIEAAYRRDAAIVINLAFGTALDDDPNTWPVGLREAWDRWIEDCDPLFRGVTYFESARRFLNHRLRCNR